SWSLPALAPAAVRAFHLLALAPGPDLGLAAAAGLLGATADVSRRLLRELAEAHLVSEPVPGRYRMHDLVRLYGQERARTEPFAERQAALRRLFDYYFNTADAADRVLAPLRDRPIPAGVDGGGTPIVDARAALAWFDAERAVLLPTVRLAAESGHAAAAWRLA